MDGNATKWLYLKTVALIELVDVAENQERGSNLNVFLQYFLNQNILPFVFRQVAGLKQIKAWCLIPHV